MAIARFGNTAVPYTVSWTGEDRQLVGMCPHARALALRMHQAPGVGKAQKSGDDCGREELAGPADTGQA